MTRRPLGIASRLFWGSTGLVAVVAAWALGHWAYGPFVLPRPDEAALALARFFADGTALSALASTAGQALGGWLAGTILGFLLGFLAGLSERAALALKPVAVMLLGVPPVVWVVLGLLWLGPDGPSPALTVTLSILPIVFLGVFQGMRARDAQLEEMADLFHAPAAQRFFDLHLPQVTSHLIPAAATALGFSWKVCVMSEVIASGTGIGGQLAMARAHLDLPETMAWILLIVTVVLICDFLLVAPLRRWSPSGAEAPVVAHMG